MPARTPRRKTPKKRAPTRRTPTRRTAKPSTLPRKRAPARKASAKRVVKKRATSSARKRVVRKKRATNSPKKQAVRKKRATSSPEKRVVRNRANASRRKPQRPKRRSTAKSKKRAKAALAEPIAQKEHPRTAKLKHGHRTTYGNDELPARAEREDADFDPEDRESAENTAEAVNTSKKPHRPKSARLTKFRSREEEEYADDRRSELAKLSVGFLESRSRDQLEDICHDRGISTLNNARLPVTRDQTLVNRIVEWKEKQLTKVVLMADVDDWLVSDDEEAEEPEEDEEMDVKKVRGRRRPKHKSSAESDSDEGSVPSSIASLVDTDDDLADLMDKSTYAKKGRGGRRKGRSKKKRNCAGDTSESEVTDDGEPVIPVEEYWEE